MKKSSWRQSRTHLSLNSDYALIPLSTDLFQNSVTPYSFYWAVSYITFAFESVWEQWFKIKWHEKVMRCMRSITCSHPRTSKCYDFWKRKTLESNINWTSEDKKTVCHFIYFHVYRIKAAGTAGPPASPPCPDISLHSHFKVWH